jgi:triosephosphate isomerase (TIM)
MTTTPIKPLVAGNWKMNGLRGALEEADAVAKALSAGAAIPDVMICPPVTLIAALAAKAAGTSLLVGGQDCHAAASGAHTGDISAEMLADAGATAVIVGHSERRGDHGETSADVRAKAEAAHRAGMTAIVCVGETAGERKAGLTLDVVRRQILGSLPKGCHSGDTIVAYEPVWAIGTGLTPTAEDVARVHETIRKLVADNYRDGAGMRLLYGGSVKPDNASELMVVENVDGALVGGASLKSADFLGIVRSYES